MSFFIFHAIYSMSYNAAYAHYLLPYYWQNVYELSKIS